jgi:type IV pilus assembly protein PilY1
VLGDIINAEPVVVVYPGNIPIIYQGANDGMLHVVDGRTDSSVATRGQALWSYVPKLVHGSLAELSDPNYVHKYYVDGTPAVASLSGTSVLLVGGLGKGGRGYYALDISSYTANTAADVASKVKWEFSPTGMGYSFGTPLIVKVGANWRVVVASGYDASVNGIWVLDPDTGTGDFINAPSASGLAHLGKLANTAADANTRFVWGGDNVGNVFRFDLVALTATRIAVLTDASGNQPQPVTSAPEVGPVPGSTTKFLVHIGTGRYLADADVPGPGQNSEAVQRQSVYGLVDDTSATNPTLPNIRGTNGSSCVNGGNGDLVCQTLSYVAATNTYRATTNAVDFATKRGWYLDLPTDTTPVGANMINGRIISRPALTTGGTLALTVNIPTSEQCDPGGRSWLLALSSITGGAVPRVVGGNTYFDSGFFLGNALASRVVVILTSTGKKGVMRMSNKDDKVEDLPESESLAANWRRIYFRPVK